MSEGSSVMPSLPPTIRNAAYTYDGTMRASTLSAGNPIVALLPDELLTEIFLFVLSNYRDFMRTKIFRRTESPAMSSIRRSRRVLSAVCVRWRNLVLDTPALWATIGFPSSFRPRALDAESSLSAASGWVGASEMLDEEAQRSKRHPLSLYVLLDSWVDNSSEKDTLWHRTLDPDDYRAIEDTLVPLLSTCRRLSLGDIPTAYGTTFMAPMSLPHLVSLRCRPHMSSASAPRTVDLSQAPLLRHLDISVVFESVMRFPPILKTCSQSLLTHIRISGVFEADSVVSIIANSPLLEDVVWSHVKRLEPGEWVTEGKYALKPVRLEHLRHLGLKGLAPLAFLSVVEAPNLVRLFLHYPLIVQGYVRRPREAFHKHHFAYLSKSIRFPRLRALDLAGQLDIWDIEYSSITAFLRAHPSLEAVKLPSQITESIADAILESLIHVRVIEALLRDRNDEGKCRTACLLDHWAQGDQDDVGKDASPASLPTRGPVPQRNRHFEYDPVEVARWLRPSPLPILCLRGESSSTKDTRFPEFDRFGDFLVRFESWPFFAFASEDWDEFWRELDAHTLEG